MSINESSARVTAPATQGKVVRIAVVGSGIAGLGSALLLSRQGHAVTVLEAERQPGGHSRTVDVTLGGRTFPVDTGFLVFNDRTYPKLVRLFDELGVASVPSDMSFSVRNDRVGLEWAGTSLATLFAQPRNMLRPAYWRMLRDILRFNREATLFAKGQGVWSVTLGEYLDAESYSTAFRDWYLVPMAAAIWSSPARDILNFPLPSFVRFCHNHGLLSVADRPQWRTVAGGSRSYVQKIVERLDDVRVGSPVLRVRRSPSGVEIDTSARRAERFDAVVLACHSDQALAMLADPSTSEARVLASVRYQPNRVILHTDTALLPRSRRVWSSWNYLTADDPHGERPVAVSYLINRLQPLPTQTPVIVTLNPPFEPDPRHVIESFEYSHPLLDSAAIAAQRLLSSLQGRRRTWYAGAWLGHGFHEDGLASAHAVAEGVSRYVATTPAPCDDRVAA
ncbi:MAG: FAD-dependent oxidoreductase [Betaproteobacteria bacterium]